MTKKLLDTMLSFSDQILKEKVERVLVCLPNRERKELVSYTQQRKKMVKIEVFL
jgi:hypothetical protein